jgi:CRP-like cAMP-binding protein
MLQPHRTLSQPRAHSTVLRRDRLVTELQSPRQNQLLAVLPSKAFLRLLPSLEPVSLRAGSIVHRAGEHEKYFYFLTSGIVSRRYVMENGATAEFSVTGNEGVVGISLFLGGDDAPTEAVVLSDAHAYRLHPKVLQSEFEEFGALSHLLLRYTMALIAQTGQIAACNRHHSLEQAFCRLILSWLDRLPSNGLAITHELVSEALGVRRESVTQAAGKLQTAGLISYHRGHVDVLDRRGLEAAACECYSVVKNEYDRLLPPEVFAEHAVRHRLTAAA